MADEIIRELDATLTELIYVLSSFDEGELNIVPFEGSWTAGQVGEHLRKSYDGIGTLCLKTKQTERAPDQFVGEIKKTFLDFSTKLKSPDFIIPDNKLYDKKELINSIETLSGQIRRVANTIDLSVTCVGFAFPVLGYLTTLEIIHFITYHTQRHIHQLKKIYQKVVQIKDTEPEKYLLF